MAPTSIKAWDKPYPEDLWQGFESDLDDDATEYAADLLDALTALPDEDDATKAAKASGTDRADLDAAFEAGLTKRFASLRSQVQKKLASGETVTRASLQKGLTRAVPRLLYDAYSGATAQLVDLHATDVGASAVDQAANDYAQGSARKLIRGLVDTTLDRLVTVRAALAADPDLDLDAALEPAFGTARVQTIATTEVTRALTEATFDYRDHLESLDLTTEPTWHTAEDERVCPICGPLDGKPLPHAPDELASGPPAHVNCRCWLSLDPPPKE